MTLPCVKTKTKLKFVVKAAHRSNHLFSVYLIKDFAQPSALFVKASVHTSIFFTIVKADFDWWKALEKDNYLLMQTVS